MGYVKEPYESDIRWQDRYAFEVKSVKVLGRPRFINCQDQAR